MSNGEKKIKTIVYRKEFLVILMTLISFGCQVSAT